MPCIPGDKFCAEIREDIDSTTLPILIQVPQIDAEVLERIYRSGASDYLLFPPAIEELTFKAWNALELRDQYLSTDTVRLELSSAIEEHTTPLKKALKEAQTASLSKTQFIANLSHEFRTPLNGIIGFTQIMRAGDLNDEQNENLRQIKKSSSHLRKLVEDILDFSKIEAGKTEMESIVFDLPAIVESVTQSFEEELAAKNTQLVCEIDPSLPPLLQGDPGKWKQALHNLLGNSVKYSDPDGAVVVLIRDIARDEDSIIIETAVCDTGQGIPAEQQAVIFDPFSQVDPTQDRSGGTGLGLSICSALVKLLGGEISVESKTGVGSRFKFSAKFRPVRAILPETFAPEHKSVFIQEVDLPELSILVVEDNKINQKLIETMLRKRGHKVTLVNDGVGAVDTFQGEDFDIVLMDCQMPVMDGYEATQKIRELERDSGKKYTPIVAVTAAAFDEDRLHCLRSGMDAVITKPIDSKRLFSKIAHLLTDPNERLGFPE